MAGSGAVRLLGQLTYTSFEAESGRGGWQTKETVGLSDDERIALEAMVPHALPHPYVADMRFVTADTAATWPRRLAYRAFPGRAPAWALFHSVSAGPDRSGRAGNVFTHCGVLDPGSLGVPPIAAWRSAGWLTPYGPDAVAATAIAAGSLSAGATLVADVNAFLRQPQAWRPGILAAILDAVRARRLGGRPVVLVCDDTDEIAGWLKALSACLSVRTAGTLPFSTLETMDSMPGWEAFDVVGLRREDADTTRLADFFVVDTAETPMLGVLGGEPHQTGHGLPIPVSVWSTVFLEASGGGEDVGGMVTDLHDLTRRVPGEDAGDPAWWLCLRTLFGEPSELAGEVGRLVAEKAPSGVESDAEILGAVTRALLESMGRTTDQRWRVLAGQAGVPPFVRRIAVAAFAQSALEDPQWLAANPGSRPGRGDAPKLTAECASALAAFPLHREPADPERRAVAGIAFCELVSALGWAGSPEGEAALDQVSAEWVGPSLLEAAPAEAVLRQVVPKHPGTLALFDAYLGAEAREGRVIPPVTLRELGLYGSRGLRDDILLERDGSLSRLGVQVVRGILLSDPAPDPRAVYHGLWALASGRLDRDAAREGVHRAVLAAGLPARDLLHLMAVHPRLPEDVLKRALLVGADPDRVTLTEHLRRRGTTPSQRELGEGVATMLTQAWGNRDAHTVSRDGLLVVAVAQEFEELTRLAPDPDLLAAAGFSVLVGCFAAPQRVPACSLPDLEQRDGGRRVVEFAPLVRRAIGQGWMHLYPEGAAALPVQALWWAASLLPEGRSEKRSRIEATVGEMRAFAPESGEGPWALQLLARILRDDAADLSRHIEGALAFVPEDAERRRVDRVLRKWVKDSVTGGGGGFLSGFRRKPVSGSPMKREQ